LLLASCQGGLIFVLKTAAVVLALLSLMLFPTTSKAQLLPDGNVYAGVAYADSVDVVNRLSFKGFDGSLELRPFHKYESFLGVVLDASGVYRKGVNQYNLVLGPRVFRDYGKWRLFAHALGGIQESDSSGTSLHPIIEDIGGGADRKLPFKKFSWRLQIDYVHSHVLSATQNDVRGSTGLVWRF
jgi:hypothetical protein